MLKIKICPADQMFSRYIRLRDKRCVRCRRPGDDDTNGDPIIGLQCSHYFGRARETTRFLPENCDALCCGCHRIWGSDNVEAYREFKIKQLGEKGFEKLRITAEMIGKRDRKLAYIFVKKLYNDLKNGNKKTKN